MKYMIASDIHGSAFYCEKLIECYKREKADRLILLGDILYHGPRNDLPEGYAPKEVIAMLNPLADRITCVRGNCDAEVDQMVLSFDVSTARRVIEPLGRRIFITHGHHASISAPPKTSELEGAQIVLYGHTHIPLNAEEDGVRYLNPGSVSIPKGGSEHSCMVLDESGFRWLSLEGRCFDRLSF